MSALKQLAQAAAGHRLFLSGALHLTPEDGLPQPAKTLVLLSPDEPGFWPHIQTTPEWLDGGANPLDRWSERVITDLAHSSGGKAYFPFGGPPYHPFLGWAQRSDQSWVSPVSLLVHARMGLMASYRGAIALPDPLPLPPAPANPCDTCAGKPCLTACPPKALTGLAYDLIACHDFLDTSEGTTCLTGGCSVRRACPVSKTYGRLAEQSAYHMRLFHK